MSAAARAEARRRALAAFGLPPDAPYGRLTMTGTDQGTARYEAALIAPDGSEAPASTVVGDTQADWPAPYVITLYGIFGPRPAATLTLPGIPVTLFYPLFSPDTPGAPPAPELPEMAVLWATVRYGRSPVYGLLETHPDGSLSEDLGGVHLRHNKIERDRAYQGLPHLLARVQGKQSQALSAADFLAQSERDALLLWEEGRRQFTPPMLYGKRGWGHSRWYQLLADCRAEGGYPWARSAKAFCEHLELYAQREYRRRRE